MKLIAILLAGIMVSSWFAIAAPRRALMGVEAQGKEKLVLESSRVMEIEFVKERVNFGHQDSSGIDNHHSIPRQDYNQWGSNSNNNDDNGDKDGSG